MADYQRKQYLQHFHQRAQDLLTDPDRDYLYQVLKEYQTYKKVDKLVQCLKSALDSPQKLDLLRDIRHLLPANHVTRFDAIAPYHKMAHPFTVPNQVKNRPKVALHTPRPRPATAMNGHHRSHTQQARVNGNEGGSFHVVTVTKAQDGSLGFSIRGGSEHGLGIYVSEVDPGSVAETSGLEVGDNIVEVNNVSFDNMASSSAVKVLTGSNKMKMVIRRTGRVPGMKFAKEKTSWFDTHMRKIVNDNFDQSTQKHLYSERRVNLTVTKREQYLGFNIRGGSEYGLGIFVSRVDRGGLAEQKGIVEGDQLVHVNSQTFENITHSNAVEFLKSQTQLVVTVRDVGRYPAFKELFAEYSWQRDSSIRRSRSDVGPQTAPPPRIHVDSSYESEGTVTQFPMESRIEVCTQTPRSEPDSFSMAIQTEEVLPEQNEIILPDMSGLLASSRHSTLNSRKKSTLDSKKSTLDSKKSTLDNKKSPKRLKELLSPNHVDRVQSFRRPGEPDPRKTSRDPSKERERSKERPAKKQAVKRSRTFKEMLFGKKPLKVKGSGSQGASIGKTKSRPPLLTKKKDKEETRKSSGEESGSQSVRSQKVFSKGLGTQVMLHEAMQTQTLAMVQDMARKLLNDDECEAVSRHINTYTANGDVELMVTPLLAILDKPEKMLLLREVRGIVRPTDLGRFDSMVSRQELEAYAELSARMSTQSPQVMRRSLNQYGPPKKTVLASVPNNRGTFHLKTKEEYEKDVLRKQEMEKLKQEKLQQLRQDEQDSGSDDYVPFASLHSPRGGGEIVAASETLQYRLPQRNWRGNSESELEPSGLPTNRNIIFRSSFVPANKRQSSSPEVARPRPGDIELYPQTSNENAVVKSVGNGLPEVSVNDEPKHSLEQALSIFNEVENEHNSDVDSASDSHISVASSEIEENIQETPLYAKPTPRSEVKSSVHNGQTSRQSNSILLETDGISAPVVNSKEDTSSDGDAIYATVSKNPQSSSLDASGQTPSRGNSGNRRSGSGLYAIIKAGGGDTSVSNPHPTEGVSGASHGDADGPVQREAQSGTPTRSILKSDGTLDSKKSLNWNDTIERKSISSSNLGSPSNQDLSPSKTDSSVEAHIPSPQSSVSSGDFRPMSTASFRSTDHPSDLSGHYDLASPGGSQSSSGSASPPPLPDSRPPMSSTPNSGTGSSLPRRAATPPSLFVASRHVSDSESDFEYPPPPPPVTDTNKTTPSPKFTPPPPPDEPPPLEEPQRPPADSNTCTAGDVFTLVLTKNRSSLGISISGGRDSKSQPQVKVEKVFPGGAAADDGTLKHGMEIISVDGESLETVTHPQAVDIVRRSYNNKSKSVMTLVLRMQ